MTDMNLCMAAEAKKVSDLGILVRLDRQEQNHNRMAGINFYSIRQLSIYVKS
jgi:hypothetical protein